MALSLQAVDRIFERLVAAYGRQFIDLYADVSPQDVKTAWSHELEVFASPDGLKRIAWALDNLPDRAPTAPAFRSLCRQAHVPEAPPLPMPAANPERMRAELAKLGHVRRKAEGASRHKDWARRIVARHEAGDKVRPISLRFAREALRITPGADAKEAL